MKGRTIEGFGERLARIRQSRALSQRELGERVGASQRVIAYYEGEDAQPPGSLLVDLAKALHVSADELLGLKVVKESADPKQARLLNRLKKVEQLPAADQRAVLKYIDALTVARGHSNGHGRSAHRSRAARRD